MSTHSLLILPGDGIGPEVMTEVRKVIAWLAEHRDVHFDVSEDLVGGAAYDCVLYTSDAADDPSRVGLCAATTLKLQTNTHFSVSSILYSLFSTQHTQRTC